MLVLGLLDLPMFLVVINQTQTVKGRKDKASSFWFKASSFC